MGECQEEVLNLEPVFGLKATVTVLSVATDGAYVEIDLVLEPGGHTDLHSHPEQEETYGVLDGTLDVFRGGRWHTVSAKESLTVPRGTTHAFRNVLGAILARAGVDVTLVARQAHVRRDPGARLLAGGVLGSIRIALDAQEHLDSKLDVTLLQPRHRI
jgi:mannose-6-phosphate isomerase-like protein (cupin superfamily)